jgi:diaminohydroxyphosphoribosylaminopyrimidine deaminase/5-amino-6-(5-phosphoribosylamino)uracil reductase
MKRCLELASMGLGHVAPNPMVGAVIVFDNKVLGEGYHKQYGKEHAEVNAINAVKDNLLIKKSTLYVNLEPCVHLGKTPPCCDLIVSKGIRKVFIGMKDPNPLVAGKGIEMLKSNGIEVTMDIMNQECKELNRRFTTFYNKKRPYIILKWAQTKDDFMDLPRNHEEMVGVNWISNKLSRILVHRWRAEEQAIMVGTNTVLSDNPQLNVRHWEGKSPIRIILDRTLRIPAGYHIFDQNNQTIIFNELKSENLKNIQFIRIDFERNMFDQIFSVLYNLNIQSIIIEGGKKVIESILEAELWDEARVIIGDKNFGKGYAAPVINQEPESISDIMNDKLIHYRNRTAS